MNCGRASAGADAAPNAARRRLHVSVDKLCASLDCISLAPVAAKILAAYKTRRLASLSDALRASANFDAPVFSVVAVGIAAARRKAKLDVGALCDRLNVATEHYNEVGSIARPRRLRR